MRIPLIWHIRVSEREWLLDRILSLFSSKLILVAATLGRRFSWLENNHKMVVIHNGIDLEEFDNFRATSSIRNEFNISNDMMLLGCVGRIEKRKGQEGLVSAMSEINNANLLLIGGGEERYINEIKMLRDRRGISDRVFFAGIRGDIPGVLKAIDILVFPSIGGEGFPRVILEAMAAKKPVIATNDAGNPEAVEDGLTGYIVPSGDIPALIEKINVLIADKKKRMVMGQTGRHRVAGLFTIQKNVKKIQKVYLDILARDDTR
jgi:glycosyltransferase involved in cell wall biosynthesis